MTEDTCHEPEIAAHRFDASEPSYYEKRSAREKGLECAVKLHQHDAVSVKDIIKTALSFSHFIEAGELVTYDEDEDLDPGAAHEPVEESGLPSSPATPETDADPRRPGADDSQPDESPSTANASLQYAQPAAA